VCYDDDRRVVWIALDYMNGGDLQSLIDSRRNARAPAPEAAFVRRVLSTVGSALRFIHSQDVLHRDVKPSNVLLTRKMADGSSKSSTLERAEIKLADFGISKILEATVNANTVVGTPPYMSPEIVCGKPYGPASDAWALGACLYELVTLRRPFEASNQLALVRQIVEQEPAALPQGTASDVVDAVFGLLRKDPEHRLTLGEVINENLVSAPPPRFAPPAAPMRSQMGALLTPRDTSRENQLSSLAQVRDPSVPQARFVGISSHGIGVVGNNTHLTPRSQAEGVEHSHTWSDVSDEELLPDTGRLSAALELEHRPPGAAFEDLQQERMQEKCAPGGRRWFKFGKSAQRDKALVPVQPQRDNEGETTYITAFSAERGDGGDSPIPMMRPRHEVF
jgi:serine/threonine protein kinase